MNLTKKDIVKINQRFSEGYFENESSLNFALSMLKQNIAWTKKLAYLVRAVLLDHAFTDGNKRTACAVLLTVTDLNGYKIEEKTAISIIKKIVLNHVNSIQNIQGMIENGITKK